MTIEKVWFVDPEGVKKDIRELDALEFALQCSTPGAEGLSSAMSDIHFGNIAEIDVEGMYKNLGDSIDRGIHDSRKLANLYRHSSHCYKVMIKRFMRDGSTAGIILGFVKMAMKGAKRNEQKVRHHV